MARDMIGTAMRIIWVTWVTLICLHACQHVNMPHGGVYRVSAEDKKLEVTVGADYGFPLDKDGWRATISTVEVTVGKKVSSRLFIGLETDLSHLSFINKEGPTRREADATVIAFAPILKYDFIKFKTMTVYGLAGVGVAFSNDTPSVKTLGHNPLGQIKAGLGFNFKFSENTTFNIGGKYDNLSSHSAGDRGINTGGISVGFTWRF